MEQGGPAAGLVRPVAGPPRPQPRRRRLGRVLPAPAAAPRGIRWSVVTGHTDDWNP